ncbi:hypothetical protein MSPP1_002108 [Malassezia sp. CBS 17886]|nr:hypothetical protein MSPP1_002108 [Malassezia sp. CBS 17886]
MAPDQGDAPARSFEIAEDHYQAPFAMPAAHTGAGADDARAGATASRPPLSRSSSFFDDQEVADAHAYVRSPDAAALGNALDASGRAPPRTRRRRDSQVGSYDDRNTVFDGPPAEIVPSSVSSMHHVMGRPSFQTYSRRQRHRRSSSYAARAGRQASSRASRDHSPSSVRTDRSRVSHPTSVFSYRKRAYPRAADGPDVDTVRDAPPAQASSLISTLFAPFRGDAADEDEPDDDASWAAAGDAPWSNGDSDMDDDERARDDPDDDLLGDSGSDRSSTSSPRGESPTGRFIPTVFGGYAEPFGDGRIPHEPRDEDDALPFDDPALGPKPMHLGDYPDAAPLLHGPSVDAREHPHAQPDERSSVWLDKQCRSRQQIYLADEDTLIRITGYRTRAMEAALYVAACVCSLGMLALFALWFPRRKLQWICSECDFARAEFVVVENQWGDVTTQPYIHVPFARPLRAVFPPSSRDPPCTHAQAHEHAPPSTDADGEVVDLVMFEYRCARYALHPPTGRFRSVRDWRDAAWTSAAALRTGTRPDLVRERQAIFGANVIEIVGRSTLQLLVGEVLHPFYMFQIVSIALWSLDDYYYYAFCIAAISVGSILSTLVETKRTIARMREMNRFVCAVRVLRSDVWSVVDSTDLVPGDVYDAADPALSVLPADSLLLTGDAIVNESMLTGESLPISKAPVDEAALRGAAAVRGDLSAPLAKHFLFAGTRVIRIRPTYGGAPDERSALAMVVRTGFSTTKGALVRGMLFPKPMGFKFYRDSFRFIGFLAGVAGVGLCFNTYNFLKLGIAWSTLLIRVLDLVTVVVPPALPATMSIGTAFAIARLRHRGIFCISPTRVNIAGKVNVVAFDKTGTLTEDGLDVLGARTVVPGAMQFSELHQATADIPTDAFDVSGERHPLVLLHALATCHGLKLVDDRVIGDPLDVKMFEFTGWQIDEGSSAPPAADAAGVPDRPPALVQTVVRPRDAGDFHALAGRDHAADAGLELGVIRTFDFVSALRRMSVIVKQLHAPSMEVFVKGAPEALMDICAPETLPNDYSDLLEYYTHHGYRVIACAGKSIPGMSWVEAQRIPREQAEHGLQFLGLIIFENKLKPGTAPAIGTLRDAHIACKMATGDNPRTAISVARECGILGQSTTVFLADFVRGSPAHPGDVALRWTSTDDSQVLLNPDTLKPLELDPLAMDLDDQRVQNYELVLTGDVFRWMTDYAPIELVRRMLIKGTIFARMSPDEKHDLVDRLQELGYIVAMCGDGANDCGALKAADIGISLSEAEASVAAPFTSTRPDISCVIEVIKEGRAALVTSFSCFKYMALYSLIQFTSISLLYDIASSLGDFQFLYIDLFIILPLAVAMARTRPYPALHTKRPTANLVSKKVLLSMFTQVALCAAAQSFTYWLTRRQSWYEPPIVNPNELNVVNAENSALFLVSSFQYIIVAAVFSVGPPYRMPIFTNTMLLVLLTILTCLSTYFLFVRDGFFFNLLGLVTFPTSFHWKLFAVVLLNTASCLVFESYFMAPALQLIKFLQRSLRDRHHRVRRHSKKTYKAVLSSLNDPAEA